MSLRANVVAAIVTAMAALILTVILVEDPLLEYRQTQDVRAELLEAIGAVQDGLAAGESADAAADRVGAERASRITIWDGTGRPVGDTAYDGAALGRVAGPSGEDVDEARARGMGTSLVTHGGVEHVRVTLRAPDGWLLRAARPTTSLSAARRTTRELLIIGGIMAAGAAILLTLVLSRTMVRPVEELTRVANALSKGDLDARTRSQRTDELGRLGRSLDEMADQLKERIARLRAEEARLAAMLEGMVEGVFVTDATGRIVRTNRAFEELVAAPASGRTVVEAIRSAELHEAVARALGGEAATVDLEASTGDEVRTLAAQVAPLPEKGGVVGVLHDVTDLKRADRVRRDFVANASHELRTPLTAIRGYAETLQGGAIDDRETAVRFVDTILRHTTRLQRLVDDLLALSRSESPEQELELEPVRLADVVREAVSAIESQAQAKAIEIRVDVGDALPHALASRWGLEHVLVNLVDNAVKYTPDGGLVTVRGRAAEGVVVLEVSDTGPGIPVTSRERIFERFYRLDKGRARDRGGTGLGLAIVKHLVSRMNAEIAVDSAAGRGTTFRVRLPSAEPPAASAGAARPAG